MKLASADADFYSNFNFILYCLQQPFEFDNIISMFVMVTVMLMYVIMFVDEWYVILLVRMYSWLMLVVDLPSLPGFRPGTRSNHSRSLATCSAFYQQPRYSL